MTIASAAHVEDIADDLTDIFPNDTTYQPKDFAAKKEFHAWHRPRKQYVRETQWCAAINELVEKIDFDGRALRYLGLPGDELFDLRTIHDRICEPRDLRLRFLGFNTGGAQDGPARYELNLSEVEVKSLAKVDPLSKVLPDDFKSLGTPTSVANTNAKNFVHFDVVNVDLCDGLFTSRPGVTSDSYYNAIKEVVNIQTKRADPWLLFLTTRIGPTDVHPDTVRTLKACVEQNMETCVQFARGAQRHLNVTEKSHVEQAFAARESFGPLFTTGMGKWLIGLGLSGNQWAVKVKSLCSYKVYPESPVPDLISAVYEFVPIEIKAQDKHNLVADRNVGGRIPDECTLAADVLPFVSNTLDLDLYLQQNPAELTELIDRAASLMTTARYTQEDYKEWARRQ